MFYFPGYASSIARRITEVHSAGFPHSEIFGSKVARHLPEAYRRHATSFVAFSSQGIHHTPFKIPVRNSKNRFMLSYIACSLYSPPAGGPNTESVFTQTCHLYEDRLTTSLLEMLWAYFHLRYVVFKLQSFCKRKTASLSGYELCPITGVWLLPLY